MRKISVPVLTSFVLLFLLTTSFTLFAADSALPLADEQVRQDPTPVTTEEAISGEPVATEEAASEADGMEDQQGEMTMTGDMPVLADGFFNPRAIHYGPDGTLYVADSGRAGEVPVEGVVSAGMGGGSSVVYTVSSDGTESLFAYGLPSIVTGGNEVIGVMDVYATEDAIWIVNGQGSQRQGDTAHAPFAYSIVQLNPATLAVNEYIDVYTFEENNNPDGQAIDSNPSDIAFGDDGTLYIADAGANALLSWTPEDGLSLVRAWENNPVPTSVDVGPDGDLYVGFLTGFPFPEDGSRVERLSASGETIETYEGLTAVVDVMVDEAGTVYAVEFATFSQDQGGWQPDTGGVVALP